MVYDQKNKLTFCVTMKNNTISTWYKWAKEWTGVVGIRLQHCLPSNGYKSTGTIHLKIASQQATTLPNLMV
jgi:hypothetical protein